MDFLGRLAHRATGATPPIRPVLPSRFEPWPVARERRPAPDSFPPQPEDGVGEPKAWQPASSDTVSVFRATGEGPGSDRRPMSAAPSAERESVPGFADQRDPPVSPPRAPSLRGSTRARPAEARSTQARDEAPTPPPPNAGVDAAPSMPSTAAQKAAVPEQPLARRTAAPEQVHGSLEELDERPAFTEVLAARPESGPSLATPSRRADDRPRPADDSSVDAARVGQGAEAMQPVPRPFAPAVESATNRPVQGHAEGPVTSEGTEQAKHPATTEPAREPTVEPVLARGEGLAVEPPSSSMVRISIASIEVRTQVQRPLPPPIAAPAPRPAERRRPRLSLDDYLERTSRSRP